MVAQGHGPTNTEDANRNDTERNNNEYVLKDATNNRARYYNPLWGTK